MDTKHDVIILYGGITKMEILIIAALILCIIVYTKTGIDIKRNDARNKQIAENMEMIRYHFWLIEVGLTETAFMFNEFGLSVSRGEEV